jgi:protein-disulfide isomerase
MSRWARAIGGTCLFALLAGTAVSHLQQTARLPAWLTSENLHYFTSSRTAVGLPLEFVLALWFLFATASSILGALRLGELVRFWSGIVALALFAGLSYQVGIGCLPITIGAIGTIGIVIDSATSLYRAPANTQAAWRSMIRDDWTALGRPERLVKLLVVTSVAALTAQYLAFSAGATTPADRDAQLMRWYESEPQLQSEALVSPGKILVVAFSDYECPACSFQIPALENTVQRYRKGGYANVEFVQRDFPLNADCNPAVRSRLHQMSCQAAVAVRVVARNLGGTAAQAFRDRLYAHHGGLAEQDLLDELDALEMRIGFQQAYDQELEAVRQDAMLGMSLAINATPTVFVNGRLIRDPDPTVLAAILAQLIERGAP